MATNADVIRAQLAATTAPYEAQINNMRLDYDATKKQRARENAQRLNELYIAYEQNKRTLPQQNSALGNTGGLTESSIIDLANTYQRNRNAQQQAYADSIADLDLQFLKENNSINAQIAAAKAEADARIAGLNNQRYYGDDYTNLIKPLKTGKELVVEELPSPNLRNWSGYGEFVRLNPQSWWK